MPIARKTVLALAASTTLFCAVPAQAVVLLKSETLAGVMINYQVVLPPNYDAARPYPAVLAFAPGEQDMAMVDFTVQANYREEAEKRGYLVFVPETADPRVLGTGKGEPLPAFIEKLLASYRVKDNKFNAAGMSNGGLAAFQIAATLPQYFVSVTGLPGFLQNPQAGQLDALGKLCVHQFAGELDEGWPDASRQQAALLVGRGFHASFSLEAGEGHVMQSLTGQGAARLFDQFDAARQGRCSP